MKLRTLLQALPGVQTYGSRDLHTTGLANDSRLVVPGNLFIARRGKVYDGTQFIADAVRAGAIAVASDLYNPLLRGVCQVIYPDLRALESALAVRYYGDPSRALQVFGVTGTNGKSSTTLLIQHLLQQKNIFTGLMGTVETHIGCYRMPAERTTADALTNQRILRDMVHAGCKAVALEVTSHGLDQGRTEGIAFDVGVFTNLSQDHLDYHGTMEKYCAAKTRLFACCPVAAVNADDPYGETMISTRVLLFGRGKKADLRIGDICLEPSGTRFSLSFQGKREDVFSPLLGLFNVYNCAAAVAALLTTGHPLESVAPLLRNAPAARGRMERILSSSGVHVIVDYAHTPDALEKALQALRMLTPRRLIVVFGCGGDRDPSKRPFMGRAAATGADLVVITNDNPRSEDPEAICQQIARGIPPSSNYVIIVDRAEAIRYAIDRSESADIILIAGKGHETYQDFHHKRVPFCDREVAEKYLAGTP